MWVYNAIIGSDNGLSHVWRQAVSWTNADIGTIGSQQTNFSEIRNKIQRWSFREMYLKMSTKLAIFWLGLSMWRTKPLQRRHNGRQAYQKGDAKLAQSLITQAHTSCNIHKHSCVYFVGVILSFSMHSCSFPNILQGCLTGAEAIGVNGGGLKHKSVTTTTKQTRCICDWSSLELLSNQW